ncbi:MAG: prolipoprotein diacylglyceryl transferase, partial [Candidatus Hydrothermae bacterium]|nr:prolipoprotein diacylglyceryl transferase [Candidatus Hydrothermae bacterium]
GIGRIGCFLVGDDYGRPSDLPWALAFPKGAPPTVDPVTGEVFRVHPTQLYETLTMLVIFAYLWRRRTRVSPPRLFGEYLVLAGLERFLVEFLRMTTPSPLPGLSVAQLIALGLMFWGLYELRAVASGSSS